ncbi:hypothetical protein HHL28_12055 [Aerophototrophica crusticola]|uniref:Uncharacterized protein n=1 Tax=Aerophototrophica crusticola TaxID=1709002 RepID=A0A858R8G2_9PROT|nr:hypothetical protein HHL28_12055 [Rhodospirillaceae bacterium B3]
MADQDKQKPKDTPKQNDAAEGPVGDDALTKQSEEQFSDGGKVDRSKTPGRDFDV